MEERKDLYRSLCIEAMVEAGYRTYLSPWMQEVVLETADEYFDYYRKRNAFWQMYGLDLPDDVLKKLYYKNALKVIPGIDASQFPE